MLGCVPADSGVASPADLAGVVTVGVTSLADAGVASLAWGGAPGRSGWKCCWWNDKLDCAGLSGNRGSDVSTEVSWPGLFGHAWFCDW